VCVRARLATMTFSPFFFSSSICSLFSFSSQNVFFVVGRIENYRKKWILKLLLYVFVLFLEGRAI
jgi:hypothetical protein